ncbi:leucine-rich repeat extensin-like protein 3 [Sipha flava]|uniref:Leucine-rich repeat extensin-like protein 3 n=2 Tax=Sipha flava TaxID=143950 RepID=A0A8B8F3H4_9HEMI|nr:leucine-rich repeat extensin-like protein 3 [Sipha flava]XP_025404842.1 leucine-rich repeat extensin-like protein 3 [Sipha flava]
MVILKIAIVTVTVVIAFASAWSTQFPQNMFHAFPSPPPPPPPPPPPAQPPFRSPFLQDTIPLLPRGYYHVQHPPFTQPLQPYRPAPPPPPPSYPQSAVRLIALQPPRPLAFPPAQHQVHTADSVHHVHVFYYYYVPADLAQDTSRIGRKDGGNDRGTPCVDQPPPTTTACPPSYIPPPPPQSPSPLPPPSPPPASIAAPTTPPPPPPPPLPPQSPPSAPTEAPCDDTVVVDNVEYYPYSGRSAPIVVAARYNSGAARDTNGNGPRDNPGSRGPEHRSSFILANYLLPPDNK